MANGVIHAIDCIVICMRPKMALKFGFTKYTDELMKARNSKPEGFTVHMNSDTKINFCVKMCNVD